MGSGTNHLGCEIRLEQDENYRKKNWSQKKHEDKVFGEVSSVDYYTGPDGHYKKENNNNTKK
jgi:hypothetical protein